MKNFANPKIKFDYIYVLTQTVITVWAAITYRILRRMMAEYEALKVEIEALKHEMGEDHADCQKVHKE